MPNPKPATPLTDALEAFADTLAEEGVNPHGVEVSLLLPDWQHVALTLEAERGAPVPGDIGRIEVGGVRYLVRFSTKRRLC